MILRILFFTSCVCLAAACGRKATSLPVEPELPTVPDSATFERYLETVALVDATTGAPGIDDPEKGLRFSRKARLELRIGARRDFPLGVSVSSRTGGGTVYSRVHAVSGGENRLELGLFSADRYTLALDVGGTRLHVLAFASE